MYINLESDYAVRILTELCRRTGRTDAGTLADATGVTPRFTLKILRKLVASELVCSFKGTHGGYQIAKKPEDITLLEVIELMEGRYCFSRCLDNENSCAGWGQSDCCKVQQVYLDISELVRSKLRAVTMDQLL